MLRQAHNIFLGFQWVSGLKLGRIHFQHVGFKHKNERSQTTDGPHVFVRELHFMGPTDLHGPTKMGLVFHLFYFPNAQNI